MSGGSFPGYRTACQVTLSRLQNGRSLCSSSTSEMLVRWLYELSMASGNAPHGKMGQQAREPTGGHFKGHQRCPCPVFFGCHWILGKECTLILEMRNRVRGSCWTFIFTEGPFPVFKDRTQRDLRKKSKDKGKGPIQRRIAKGNIPKLGDDQERRNTQTSRRSTNTHKWRKTD